MKFCFKLYGMTLFHKKIYTPENDPPAMQNTKNYYYVSVLLISRHYRSSGLRIMLSQTNML